MKVDRVVVRNYRTLEDISIEFSGFYTAIFEIVATRPGAKANRDADALAEANGLLVSLSASFFSPAGPEVSLP